MDEGAETPLDPASDSGIARADEVFTAGEVLGERYRVLRFVARGGMGEVYAAEDLLLEMRRVALKTLRPAIASDETAMRRFRREIQLAQRVSHPNVCRVFDLGFHTPDGGGPRVAFLSMQLVDGVSLRRWLIEAPRTSRAILDVFVGAGRGLAAAHARALVHRDFKPDNVLVDRAGVAHVADFGLARAAGAADLPDGPDVVDDGPAMTRSGGVLGTPAYMAPEQARGLPTGPAGDQFSYCVALWEALTGALPFPAEGRGAAALPAPRDGAELPRRVRRLLARGLDVDPARRHPSMEALVAALERQPSVGPWLGIAAGAVALAVAAVAFRPSQLDPCAGFERRLAGVWDPGAKAALVTAFARTGRPYAVTAAGGVTATLDGYGAALVDGLAASCRAPGGEAPRAARDRCLDERLEDLRAMVGALAHVDGEGVDRALSAAGALVEPGSCLRPARLAVAPPPFSPATRARVERTRALVAGAHAQGLLFRTRDGLPVAEAGAAEAAAIGYRPLQAEAGWVLGEYHSLLGDRAGAERLWRRALAAAQAGRHDALVARLCALLAEIVGAQGKRFDDGRAWLELGYATLDRLGGDDALELDLVLADLAVAFEEQRRDEAGRLLDRAMALALRQHDDAQVADLETKLARRAYGLARYAEAEAHATQAADVLSRLYGPGHPMVATAQIQRAMALESAGKQAQGIVAAERAVAILEGTLGPEHLRTLGALERLGRSYQNFSQHEKAVAVLERVVAVEEKVLGPDHVDLSRPLISLASAYNFSSRSAEAVTLLQRALRLAAPLGPEHTRPYEARVNLGWSYAHLGRLEDAAEELTRCHDDAVRHLGARSPYALSAQMGMGSIALERRRWAEAFEACSRAAEAFAAAGDRYREASALDCAARGLTGLGRYAEAVADAELAVAAAAMSSAEDRAVFRLSLAGALWGLGEHARARAEAAQARIDGATDPKKLALIDAWLARPWAGY